MPPKWAIAAGSLLIAGHLVTVLVGVLAAPSGPWPAANGAMPATPPQFAFSVDSSTRPYLSAIKFTHNYHYPTNRPGIPSVKLEIKLKDATGAVTNTIHLPDPNANPIVRRKQELLAQALGDDQPVAPLMTEVIAAPNRKNPQVTIWDMTPTQQLALKTIDTNLIPRDRPVFRPSEWSMLMARSYARYLCREHGAASVEILRHSKEPFPPMVLISNELNQAAFPSLTSTFGDLSR
jgi:hypothetical protein